MTTLERRNGGDAEPVGLGDAMMMRGMVLRQLRLLEEADEAERRQRHVRDVTCRTTGAECKSEHEYRDLDVVDDSRKEEDETDHVVPLGDGKEVLLYDTYLAHQRYYDDYKHVNSHYLDFGAQRPRQQRHGAQDQDNNNNDNELRILLEQRKSLGKGGFVWDAGFILGEHLIATRHAWASSAHYHHHEGNEHKPVRVVELGSGTGLTGIMLAKAVPDCHVTVTDLPELLDLLRSNIELNFRSGRRRRSSDDDGVADNLATTTTNNNNNSDSDGDSDHCYKDITDYRARRDYDDDDAHTSSSCAATSTVNIDAAVLRWGQDRDMYEDAPYDVIVGADVVASIYDPVKLARTFHDLSGPKTKIYLACNRRLSDILETFLTAVRTLFRDVALGHCSSSSSSSSAVLPTSSQHPTTTSSHNNDRTLVSRPRSRNNNPNVFIVCIQGKIC